MTKDELQSKYGTIETVTEVHDFECGNLADLHGENGARLGLSGMLTCLGGQRSMDGYRVRTDKAEVLVLIDNMQSCCENWGYIASDDDLEKYEGCSLRDIELTDKALDVSTVEDAGLYLDMGGIQFVTFKTDAGPFQLAVYNGHNGYYGHGIIVAVDGDIICSDTL